MREADRGCGECERESALRLLNSLAYFTDSWTEQVHLANTIAQRLKTEPAKRTRPDRSNAGDDGGTGLPAG